MPRSPPPSLWSNLASTDFLWRPRDQGQAPRQGRPHASHRLPARLSPAPVTCCCPCPLEQKPWGADAGRGGGGLGSTERHPGSHGGSGAHGKTPPTEVHSPGEAAGRAVCQLKCRSNSKTEAQKHQDGANERTKSRGLKRRHGHRRPGKAQREKRAQPPPYKHSTQSVKCRCPDAQ